MSIPDDPVPNTQPVKNLHPLSLGPTGSKTPRPSNGSLSLALYDKYFWVAVSAQ